jgi:hypothetical protein
MIAACSTPIMIPNFLGEIVLVTIVIVVVADTFLNFKT